MNYMSCIKKLLFLLLFRYCLASEIVEDARIVGGVICDPRDYPYIVSIYSTLNCGGTLVTLRWVLTAAHCLRSTKLREKEMMVRSGFQIENELVQERYGILAATHKKFVFLALSGNDPELRYDIGMVLVDKAFVISPVVNVIKLPKKGFTKLCKKAKVLGIGLEEILPYERGSGRPLKCVDLPIVNKTTCSLTYPNSVVDDNIVCTMEQIAGKDACKGDSGGPLICAHIQIGIVSFGRGCANANYSGTYTSVEYNLQFINDTMEENKHYELALSTKGISNRNKQYWLAILISLLVNQIVSVL